jgi:hypothetical protein
MTLRPRQRPSLVVKYYPTFVSQLSRTVSPRSMEYSSSTGPDRGNKQRLCNPLQ